MKTTYKHQVTVKGRGVFPVDMLRYDQCTVQPYQGVSKAPRQNNTYKVEVTTLRPTEKYPFTAERWNSFGAVLFNYRCEPVKE